MIAGNNELAVALVMLTPILYFLYHTVSHRLLRWIIGLSMMFIAFAILGTQSRGALLSLLAMGFVLGLKGKYPVRNSLGILVLMTMIIAFMPDSWSSRMDTIQGYQADSSAMSRIYTWKTLWALAQERPILGAGFGTDNLRIFERFAPNDPEFAGFRGRVWVAHSIYLQALGEHGFPGLILYLLIGLMTWRVAARLTMRTRDDPEFADWVPLLVRMVQVSLVGFAVGGAFLSLMHLDVVYYLVGFVVLADATVRETQAAREQAKPPIPLTFDHSHARTFP
jgi:probable O-glycosylation ligase (exosortase A-associated)